MEICKKINVKSATVFAQILMLFNAGFEKLHSLLCLSKAGVVSGIEISRFFNQNYMTFPGQLDNSLCTVWYKYSLNIINILFKLI